MQARPGMGSGPWGAAALAALRSEAGMGAGGGGGGCSACAGLAQAPAVHTDLRGNADTTETRLGNPWLHGEVTPGPAGHS